MRNVFAALPCALLLALFNLPAAALTTTVDCEADDARLWAEQHLQTPKEPLFHFDYDHENSAAFLSRCRTEASSRVVDADRTEHTLTWTDAGSGLGIRSCWTSDPDRQAFLGE